MKKPLFFLAIFVTAFLCIFFVGINSPIKTYAYDSPDITNTNYSSSYNFDSTLFFSLKALAKQINNGNNISGFNADLFSIEYQNYIVDVGSDGESIIADLNNGILNLTTGENAKYLCLTNVEPIASIEGLNDLDLSNITTLILDNNQISTITSTNLNSLEGLETLSVSNNKLASFNLNPAIIGLNQLNLTNNLLSEIDLSKLAIKGTTRPIVNLSNNKFENALTKIVYPTSKLSFLDLSFNRLTILTESDLSLLDQKIYTGGTLNIFIQGFKNDETLLAGQKVLVSNKGQIEDFCFQISYFEGDEQEQIGASVFYEESIDNTILISDESQVLETFFLPAGKLSFAYFSGETEINLTNFPLLPEYLLTNFSKTYKPVSIGRPSALVFVNNQAVTNFNQTENLQIRFQNANQDIANLSDVQDETLGAKIFCGFSINLDVVQNVLDVTSNGNYTCYAKIVFDGLESQTTTISVSRNNLTGAVWAIIIIIIVLVIIFSVYYISRWYRDGAEVAPLSEKEIHRLNVKARKKEGKGEEEHLTDFNFSKTKTINRNISEEFVDISEDKENDKNE